MIAARRHYVAFENGRSTIVEAEDQVEALAIAQREGSVKSIACNPQQVDKWRHPAA